MNTLAEEARRQGGAAGSRGARRKEGEKRDEVRRARAASPSPQRLPTILLLTTTLALLALLPATALKVSPAAKSLTFTTAGTESYALRVINDLGEPLAVSVRAEGALAPAITVTPSSFTMSGEERERRVMITARVTNASTLSPGRNLVKILVSASAKRGGEFGGAITLAHNLNLHHPYPGAHVEGSLSARSEEEGVRVTLGMRNEGAGETTVQATGEVRHQEERLLNFSLGERPLASNEEGKLERVVRARLEPGKYEVTARIAYHDPASGDVQRAYATSLLVGDPRLAIGEPAGTLRSGETSKLALPLTLSWDSPLNASATLQLLRGEEAILTTRTPTRKLEPGSRVVLNAYLELEGVTPGNYSLKVTITGDQGLRATRRLPATIHPAAKPAPAPGEEQEREAAPPTPQLLLVLVLLVLVLLVLAKRRERKG